MDSRDLSKEQAAKLQRQVRPLLVYLHRLRDRMEYRGWAPKDKLFKLVVDAHEAVFQLHVELHYLTCDSGVGELARHDPDAARPRQFEDSQGRC